MTVTQQKFNDAKAAMFSRHNTIPKRIPRLLQGDCSHLSSWSHRGPWL